MTAGGKTCSFEGCDKGGRIRRGLCIGHYQQKYLRGQELRPLSAARGETLEERMNRAREEAEVDANGCWLWPWFRNTYGYGQARRPGGGTTQAHRAAYEVWVGPIPAGEAIHHKCANSSCFNPDHLQPVTTRENAAEMLERKAYQARIEELEAELRRQVAEKEELRRQVAVLQEMLGEVRGGVA